jgi:acyl-coenzyme A thioesterase PaaI-like protein
MKKESLKTWRFRFFMNLYPMYFGTGGKITFLSSDWREVRVRLRRSLWTYNYVGTIFGGSMFSASDPFYMLMLFHNLGKHYVVWDKSASIRFKKPGKTTLYAHFELDEKTIAEIKEKAAYSGETDWQFIIQWKDKSGKVHAEIERTVYVADKCFYQNKLAARQQAV